MLFIPVIRALDLAQRHLRSLEPKLGERTAMSTWTEIGGSSR
jgi:hypothetical protein